MVSYTDIASRTMGRKSVGDFRAEEEAFNERKRQREMQEQMQQINLQAAQQKLSAPSSPFQGTSWDSQVANEAYRFNLEKGMDESSARQSAVDMVMGSKTDYTPVKDPYTGQTSIMPRPRSGIFGAAQQPGAIPAGDLNLRNMDQGDIEGVLGGGPLPVETSLQTSPQDLPHTLDPRAVRSPEVQIDLAKKTLDPNRLDEQRTADAAKARVTGNLNKMAAAYGRLDNLGEAVSYKKDAGDNVITSAKTSRVGQGVGRVLGTEAQAVRDQINMMRPTLVNDIRQAAEMGAKGMDSEKELEFFLQAATDPARDLETNMAAISVLNNAYGLGSKMNASPEKIDALIGEFSSLVGQSGAQKTITAEEFLAQ